MVRDNRILLKAGKVKQLGEEQKEPLKSNAAPGLALIGPRVALWCSYHCLKSKRGCCIPSTSSNTIWQRDAKINWFPIPGSYPCSVNHSGVHRTPALYRRLEKTAGEAIAKEMKDNADGEVGSAVRAVGSLAEDQLYTEWHMSRTVYSRLQQ